MDVLLVAINAKYIHLSLAVRLLKANSTFDVDYVEFTLKDPLIQMVETITQTHAKIVGLSVAIWNAPQMLALCKQLKSAGFKVMLGGPEVSYDAAYYLKESGADVVVCGEGEGDFDAVVSALIAGNSNLSIASAAWQTQPRNVPTDAQGQAVLEKLVSGYAPLEHRAGLAHRIAYVEASRGCPYRCSFCLSSLERGVRFFPLETVLVTLDQLAASGVRTFKFLDRTFNASKSTKAIIDHIVKHHPDDAIYQFEITGDILAMDWIEHIHQNAPKGLFRFEIGIQSIHPSVNASVDRPQNTARLFDTVRTLMKAEIITLHLDLIAGLPGEDLPMFIDTFNATFKLGASELQCGFLKLLRGTKIRHQAAEHQTVFNATPPYEIIRNRWLDEADLACIHAVETALNLFHNRGLFGDFVYKMFKTLPSPFQAFLDLYHALVAAQVNVNRYQLDELYAVLEGYLKTTGFSYACEQLRRVYLLRAKVKPKCYFPVVRDQAVKSSVFAKIAAASGVPVALFHKHAWLVEERLAYVAVLYQRHTACLYACDKPV